MKYRIEYSIEIEAEDRTQAKRLAVIGCPDEDFEIAAWELDEAGYKKGRVM